MRKDTQDGRYRAPIELERDSYTRKLREDISGTFSASSHALSPLVESSTELLAHCPTELLWKEPVVTFFSLWISFAWGVMFLVSLKVSSSSTGSPNLFYCLSVLHCHPSHLLWQPRMVDGSLGTRILWSAFT